MGQARRRRPADISGARQPLIGRQLCFESCRNVGAEPGSNPSRAAAEPSQRLQWERQGWQRYAAGEHWKEHGHVFTSRVGTQLDPSHVRRDFRRAIVNAEGVDAQQWTPRELRHSFVSLLSNSGVRLEEISRLVGHSGTAVTEEVYRKQIRPVIQTGAVAMDGIFKADPKA